MKNSKVVFTAGGKRFDAMIIPRGVIQEESLLPMVKVILVFVKTMIVPNT